MKIKLNKDSAKTFKGMDGKTKERIRAALHKRPNGDVKPLTGSSCLYRLRVGGYRILFSYMDDETIAVDRIASRGDVYKGV